MRTLRNTLLLVGAMVVGLSLTQTSSAEGLDAAVQTKIDAKIKDIQKLAADPAIVAAVKDANAKPASEMTQDKWKSLNMLSPEVKAFTKNPAADVLKKFRDAVVTEGFLSRADGEKVAFLAKTTNWSHKGKPKHDVPMTGKTWQGPVEVDESSGQQQLQVSVPVLDGDKPIGSLVIGLGIAKLKD